MRKDKIDRLENHISALEKSYDNIILMLNEDIEVDKESQKVKLKDSQRKVYAEGIQKSSETANSLLAMIDQKTLELDALKKESKNKAGVIPIKKVEDNSDYPLQKHLN